MSPKPKIETSHTAAMPIKDLEEQMRWKRYIQEHYNLREYRLSRGSLSALSGPRGIGFWGSWKSLVNRAIKE